MSDDQKNAIDRTDLEAESGAALPDKEAMSLLDTGLLNLDVNLDLNVDAAAPIDAAVAANANVAAPVDAAVSANIASPDATSLASASQDSLIVQDLHGIANATGDQASSITQ